jgi:hypothetical protein
VAGLPVRLLGAVLLTLSLTVGSCQAFVGALPDMKVSQPLDQRDIYGDALRSQ